jgi:hypothetical protein
MKTIQLSRGKFALVDDEDFDYLNQFKWTAQKSTKGDLWYATRSVRKKIIHNGEIYWNTKIVSMHREILGLTFNDTEIMGDHVNNDTLDNQRHNLRKATVTQNMKNRRSKGTKTSKYKGVNQRGVANQWRATIHNGEKIIHLGTFASETDAALAYNLAAIEFHGEFANLNNVEHTKDYIPQRIKTHKIPNTTSKYRGVCFVKSTNNWQTSIKANGRIIHIGIYKTELDAAQAYNNAAKEYHGNIASLNAVNGNLFVKKNERTRSSIYRGVSWYKNSSKWVSRIVINGKRKCLGYFDTELAAAEAYKNYQ